jgi:hypothetical protein
MKLVGWEGRLITYLHTVKQTAFRPGTVDCGLFFAGGVHVITGVDHAGWLRGKYRSIEAGLAMLQKRGFADHIAYAESLFEPHSAPIFAQRGDGAVVIDLDGNPALGIVQGEYVYVMGLNGLGFVPLTNATKALKI